MGTDERTIRIGYPEMKSEFYRILVKSGFTESKADLCAEIFAQNSLEGVYSHGVNRFPRFVKYVTEGYIIPGNEPSLVHTTGPVEQWDGNLGPGPINALFATDRVLEIASENGLGMVAMANTNHWMRGGTYGWHAARKGYVFIGWTNTEANMPPWGAVAPKLGNNPLVLAIPFGKEAVVMDFAMSQYSYGKMETVKLNGEQLPYPGGFDKEGLLTADPEKILETRRTLPVGYWKGAGLALVLDILASILSGGLSTHGITARNVEYGLSQVFVAIDLKALKNYPSINSTVRDIITDYKNAEPFSGGNIILYPGEKALTLRKENLDNGIPVNRSLWEEILIL